MMWAKNKHRFFLGGGGLLLLGIALLSGYLFWDTDTAESSINSVTEVRRGNLSVSLLERGVVRPAKVEPIKSKISSNQAQLVWAAEEGSPVVSGQVIARFDTKPFADKLERAEQDLADVVATLEAARKSFSVKQVQADGAVQAAERKLDIARISAADLLYGSGQLQRQQLNQHVTQKNRLLDIAQKEQVDMAALFEKGHVSRRELDKADHSLQTSADNFSLAKAELDNFERYEWPRLSREAELMVEAAQKDLEQARKTSQLELQRAGGEIKKLEGDRAKAQNRLERATEDVHACDIHAPIDGILLYKEMPYSGGRRKVQIGDAVWFGQTFMEIPDTSAMNVELNVREIDVAKLRNGLPAQVELDALPGKIFSAEVGRIYSLATEEEDLPGVRSFKTIIELKDRSQEIYAGMSASVRVLYQEHSDVLIVPAGAIIYENGHTFVRKLIGEEGVKVPVAVGELTPQEVVISAGLKEGEKILFSRNTEAF